MFTLFLGIVVLVLIALLLLACRLYQIEKDRTAYLLDWVLEQDLKYEALEQGRDEESEAYQQELLDSDDKIASLKGALEDHSERTANYDVIAEEINYHSESCLPIFGYFYETLGGDKEPAPIFDELADLMYG